METQTTSNMKKPEPVKQDDKYPVKRGFVGNFFFGVGMIGTYIFLNFTSEGKKNIPTSNPYVIAANHQTYVDGMWVASFLPRKHFKVLCSLAGSDLETEHGRLGRIIMRVGQCIAIDRFGSPIRGLIKAKKEVEKGKIILVHPEGTRTHDGRVAELKDGAAYIAVKANVPILPVYIEGGYSVFSRHMKKPSPWDSSKKKRRKVIIHYGPPVDPNEYDKNPHAMTEAIQNWMSQMEKKANGNADEMTSNRT